MSSPRVQTTIQTKHNTAAEARAWAQGLPGATVLAAPPGPGNQRVVVEFDSDAWVALFDVLDADPVVFSYRAAAPPAAPGDLRALARAIHAAAPYKDKDGRVYLRVHAPWEAEVYDRRGARPSLHVGDLFRLDLEDMHLAAVPGFGYAYVPRHGRERAVEDCRGAVAQWDRVAHILNHSTVAQGPDSFATAGVDRSLAPDILGVLLARGVVTVAQVQAIFQEAVGEDEAASRAVEQASEWAWG